MGEFSSIQDYTEHAGTIRVSGSTMPKNAGKCAFHYLQKGHLPDFLVIGGNANQQATKAMGVFCFMVDHSPELKSLKVAFQPLLFYVTTRDPNGLERKKSATVWRTVTIERTK